MLPLFRLLDKRHSTYCINTYYVKDLRWKQGKYQNDLAGHM
jgi:hypothetical protein